MIRLNFPCARVRCGGSDPGAIRAYVAGAASRVSGVEEGDLIYLVGGTFWPFALLGAVSFYLECVKYLEAVVGTSSRRNM